jgi:hypothetical protein
MRCWRGIWRSVRRRRREGAFKMGALAGFFTHPALFIGGLIAVLSPIIIHLLNKRKFKKIDWAAMDFLLQAQKLNKRRVKMEEFILLLLRCLAMLLLGIFLARPFLSFDQGGGLFKSAKYERVIVFDDSLSMQSLNGNTTPLSEAKKMLDEWITGLASDGSDDSLTLIKTSQPSKPVFNGVPLTEESVTELLDEIKATEAADGRANLTATLAEVEKLVSEGGSGDSNRIVYVLTDLRTRDWTAPAVEGDAAVEKDAVATLKRISEKAAGCYVMDMASEGDANLLLADVVPRDKTLVAGVATSFDVVVRNLGREAASDVKVKFSAMEGIPMETTIDRIDAGDSGTANFSYSFAQAGDESVAPSPVTLRAEIVTEGGSVKDLLPEDNMRFFPARVVRGIKVLVVDGDPAGMFGARESYFLKRALAPRGSVLSGIDVDVVDDSELDNVRLDEYQVIFLANLYRVTAERRSNLEEWVTNGGGLILSLGNQVDEDIYNEEFYAGGAGLMPGKLVAIGGDESEEKWVFFDPQQKSHPVLKIFEGESNPLLEGVKVFRWWRVAIPEEALKDGTVALVATYTDVDKSPAFVEKRFGEGRVMLVTTPLDLDWNNWPEDGPSYVISMQEMAHYFARSNSREGELMVGEPLEFAIDLADHRAEAGIVLPGAEDAVPVQALAPSGGGGDASRLATEWRIRYEDTKRRGFYKLQLTPTSGGEAETVLFAANIDPEEGALQRAIVDSMRNELADGGIELVQGNQPFSGMGAKVAKSEFWKLALYVLAGILIVELLYGWWIGARRAA